MSDAFDLQARIRVVLEGVDQALQTVSKMSTGMMDAAEASAPLDKALNDVRSKMEGAAQAAKDMDAAMSSNAKAAKDESAAQQDLAKSLDRTGQALKKVNEEQGKAPAKAAAGPVQAGTPVAAGGGSAQNDQVTQAIQRQTTAVAESAAQQDKLSKTTSNLSNSNLPRLRYALYDVSFAFGIAGAAMTAGGLAVAATSIQYDKLFANVERTYEGIDGLDKAVSTQNLKQQLLQITADLPVTFEQVTDITRLANQMSIPATAVSQFTEVVAKFAATANVSTEEAATSFGRLGQLLSTTDYRGLGDEIAYLGVNAVATDQQIMTLSAQIAASANSVGYTKEQTLALATAMASLGTKPENARGTILRVFNQIRNAVSGAGQQLADLARISGMSADEFANKWRTDASGAFTAFVAGLGGDVNSVNSNLASVGITAARDVQAISLLAQNTEVLTGAQEDSAKAAGYLDKAFGVIDNTVASKITKLQNDIKRLFDTIGSGAAGPIGVLVDGLAGLVNLLNDIVKNPIAAWGVSITLALGTLGGVVLIAMALFFRLAGTIAAVRTATAMASDGEGVFGLALDIITGKAFRAAAANDALAASQRAVGASGGEAAAGQAAAAAASDGAAASGGKLSKVLGRAGLVGAALSLAAMLPGIVETLHSMSLSMRGATVDADSLAAKLALVAKNGKDAAGSQALGDLGKSLSIATSKAATNTSGPRSTLAGPNQYTGAQLAYNQMTTGSATPGKSFGLFDGGALLNQTMQDAQKEIQNWDAALAKIAQGGNMQALNQALDQFHTSMKGSNLTTEQQNTLLTQLAGALGVTSGAQIQAAMTTKQHQDALEQDSDAFKSFMDDLFSTVNAANQLATDMSSLGGAFVDNGADVAASGTEMQKVINDIYAATGGGPAAASQMQALFDTLVAGGFASAQQLALLQQVISSLTGGQVAIADPTFDASSLVSGFNKATAAANKAGGAARGAGNEAAGAAAKVRTLVDYANDLGNVMQRAFDIRFAPGQGLDKIATGWSQIRKAAADAADAMQKAQATLSQLSADKQTQEYWLSVANMYGDQLRASQIQADLAKNASDTADAQKQLADAQDKTNMTLVGNSDAAIANRATVLGLVSSYEDYIKQLAASGADQATLNAEAQRLRAEFIQQATQLGFNQNELGKYAAAFDDVTTAINRVPRDITVTANTNPALQALNELEARVASMGGKTYSGGTVQVGADTSAIDRAVRKASLLAQYNDAVKADYGAGSAGHYLAQSLLAQIQSGNYASGGYTGDGGKFDVAGVVHKGEFVFDQSATRAAGPQTLSFLADALRTGRSFQFGGGQKQPGGLGQGGIVELSPFDRQLLMEIREAAAQPLIGSDLRQAVGAQNANGSRRGVA